MQPLQIRVKGAVALAEVDLLAGFGHKGSWFWVSRRRVLASMRRV